MKRIYFVLAIALAFLALVPKLQAANPYDLNGDGKVDLKDLFILSMAFGSYPGHPRWNPNCDFNSDETVNLKDLFAFVKHWGT